MPWKPGQSGNPSGGKKANPKLKRTITELAREYAPNALRTLNKVMNDPKSTSTARAIAADRILDRAYGKPPAAIGVVSLPGRPLASYSDAELSSIIAGALLPKPQDDVLELEAIAQDAAAELSPPKSDGDK